MWLRQFLRWRLALRTVALCVFAVGIGLSQPSFAAEVEQTRRLLITGQYDQCAAVCAEAIQQRVFGEEWYLFKAEAEFQTGRYSDSFTTIVTGLTRYAWSCLLYTSPSPRD